MPDYQRTRIYYILVGEEKYYGHTTYQYLSRRTAGHRECFRKGDGRKLYTAARALGMTDKDLICVLVENYPCSNVDEAKARERFYIEREGTLNVSVPGRTRKETVRAYYEANKEKIKAYNVTNADRIRILKKEYHRAHKDEISVRNAQYNKDNAVVLKEYRKKYYEENKASIYANNRAYALNNPEATREMKRKSAEKHREATNERVRARRAAAKLEKAAK